MTAFLHSMTAMLPRSAAGGSTARRRPTRVERVAGIAEPALSAAEHTLALSAFCRVAHSF